MMGFARYFCVLICLMAVQRVAYSQFNDSRQNVGGGNQSAFNQGRTGNFNDYRQKLNAEYISKTREKWGSFNAFRGQLPPDRDAKPIRPISMSDEDARRNDHQDNRLNIDGIISPIRNGGNPAPIAPVKETPDNDQQYHTFTYLGSSMQVRVPRGGRFSVTGTSENAIADAWERLCDAKYNNMILDCIKLRSTLKLCDWAYLMMLQTLGESYCGSGTNEATILMAYLFSQSGYKMRLGRAGGRLEMLYASQHKVYNTPYYECDGDKFFTMSKEAGSIQINAARYPKEQSLSLWVADQPHVPFTSSATRTLTSKRYPEISIQVSENKNLMTFFNTYPTSEVGGNFMTRWAMYANSPICGDVQKALYPQLQKCIAGRSQLDAVERLLNWVQTAFVYEYDDKVWGGDRAFFPDETLYYPYCDCEDRSILFTRLVRDLLGLKCILIYYPGHLAAAVRFTEQVSGDYIQVGGSRYVVCDPTYIGAPVGRTMPNMDNQTAKVIVL